MPIDSTQMTEITQLLRELITWAKIQNAPRVKELVQEMTSQEKVAYELSDGIRTQSEIGKQVGVTQVSISNWWKKWAALGLTSNSEIYAGRQRKNFSLADFGFSKPTIKGSVETVAATTTDETEEM